MRAPLEPVHHALLVSAPTFAAPGAPARAPAAWSTPRPPPASPCRVRTLPAEIGRDPQRPGGGRRSAPAGSRADRPPPWRPVRAPARTRCARHPRPCPGWPRRTPATAPAQPPARRGPRHRSRRWRAAPPPTPSWESSIQLRRCPSSVPMSGRRIRSTTGAHRNFSVYTRLTQENMPMVTRVTPRLAQPRGQRAEDQHERQPARESQRQHREHARLCVDGARAIQLGRRRLSIDDTPWATPLET